MTALPQPRPRLLRDARADWRRWSVAERIAACALGILLGAGGPAIFVVLALPGPM
jgi:hypothetical protein